MSNWLKLRRAIENKDSEACRELVAELGDARVASMVRRNGHSFLDVAELLGRQLDA